MLKEIVCLQKITSYYLFNNAPIGEASYYYWHFVGEALGNFRAMGRNLLTRNSEILWNGASAQKSAERAKYRHLRTPTNERTEQTSSPNETQSELPFEHLTLGDQHKSKLSQKSSYGRSREFDSPEHWLSTLILTLGRFTNSNNKHSPLRELRGCVRLR